MEASCRNKANSGLLGPEADTEEATGNQKDSRLLCFLLSPYLSFSLSVLLPSCPISSHPSFLSPALLYSLCKPSCSASLQFWLPCSLDLPGMNSNSHSTWLQSQIPIPILLVCICKGESNGLSSLAYRSFS